MIIRSQNKLKTTTDLNLEIYDCHDDIFLIVNQTVDTLGIYSTKEKAIKVLDMIQEAYAKMRRNDCINNGSIKEYALLPKTEQDTNLEYFKNMYCFNMPKDSEV